MVNENTPTIKTKRLILRKFQQTDVQALFEILSDEEVNAYLPWFPLKSIDEARLFLQEKFLDYYNKSSTYRYAICLKKDNIPIGYIWLSDSESHDLGYGLKKEFWHKGITTESARALVEKVKNSGYPYITATHDRCNTNSGKVMKNLGMKYMYSYVEQWQPKDICVTFRMYQLNFHDNNMPYMKYWNDYENHFVEDDNKSTKSVLP